MRISSVPVFMAGFCAVAVVMALFLTLPPSEEEMRTAVTTTFGKPGIAYFNRLGCSLKSGSEYSCSFENGSSQSRVTYREGIFTKKDGEWKYSK